MKVAFFADTAEGGLCSGFEEWRADGKYVGRDPTEHVIDVADYDTWNQARAHRNFLADFDPNDGIEAVDEPLVSPWMSTAADEQEARKVLWLHHGHQELYGDDGEMQCGACPADFLREPLAILVKRVFAAPLALMTRERGEQRLKAAHLEADIIEVIAERDRWKLAANASFEEAENMRAMTVKFDEARMYAEARAQLLEGRLCSGTGHNFKNAFHREGCEGCRQLMRSLNALDEAPPISDTATLRSLRTELWDGVRAHGLRAPVQGSEGARLIAAYCGSIVEARERVHALTEALHFLRKACDENRHAVSRDHLRWYIDNALANGLTAAQHPVRIVYTNYRGETAPRTIIPRRLWFGSTEWHPEEQWLLDALDVEKNEQRSFAVADISKWERT